MFITLYTPDSILVFLFIFEGALPYWTLMQIFQFNFFIKELIMFVVPLPTCIRLLYWNIFCSDSPYLWWWCQILLTRDVTFTNIFSLTMLIISDSLYLCCFNILLCSWKFQTLLTYVAHDVRFSLPMLLMMLQFGSLLTVHRYTPPGE